MITSIFPQKSGEVYAAVTDETRTVGGYLVAGDYDNSSPLSVLNEFFSPIMNNGGFKNGTGILPPGVLAVTNEFVVFERPPEYKNLFICPRTVSEMTEESLQEENLELFRVPIPWQLYIVHYNISKMNGTEEYYTTDVRMHFMSTNLMSFDQEVFMAPLPNFYANGNLCRPMFSTMDEIERYSKDITGVIESAYDWIWNNGTNLDLTECIAQYYIQSRSIPVAETVFGKRFTRIPHRINVGSYYVMFDALQLFMQEWEQLSLEEACNLKWPTNSNHKNPSQQHRINLVRYLPDFLMENGQEPFYESHYDEETDSEYRCDPTDDPQEYCDCMIPENSYDIEAFTNWLNSKLGVNYSVKDSFDNFVELFKVNNNWMSHKLWYNNNMAKIYHSA